MLWSNECQGQELIIRTGQPHRTSGHVQIDSNLLPKCWHPSPSSSQPESHRLKSRFWINGLSFHEASGISFVCKKIIIPLLGQGNCCTRQMDNWVICLQQGCLGIEAFQLQPDFSAGVFWFSAGWLRILWSCLWSTVFKSSMHLFH